MVTDAVIDAKATLLEPVVEDVARIADACAVFLLIVEKDTNGTAHFLMALQGGEVDPVRVRAMADKIEEAVRELRQRADLMKH